MSKKKNPLAALERDDPVVRSEVRAGLGLRKVQLEKLRKSAELAGVGAGEAYDLLKLHGKGGIPRFFGDDTTGTMFDAVYPLRELLDPESDETPIDVENEGELARVLAAWWLQDKAEDVCRWIDANGRVFDASCAVKVSLELSHEAPEPKLVSDARPPAPPAEGEKVLDAKARLAKARIMDEKVLTQEARERIVAYLESLEGAAAVDFAERWLDPDIELDAKPRPPDTYSPGVEYGKDFDAYLEGHGLTCSAAVRAHFVNARVPLRLVPKEGSGKKKSVLLKRDAQAAIAAYVNEEESAPEEEGSEPAADGDPAESEEGSPED